MVCLAILCLALASLARFVEDIIYEKEIPKRSEDPYYQAGFQIAAGARLTAQAQGTMMTPADPSAFSPRPDLCWHLTWSAHGWLDNETLLLQGQLADGSIHVMNFGPMGNVVSTNGSGEAVEAQVFVPGEFLGFVFP